MVLLLVSTARGSSAYAAVDGSGLGLSIVKSIADAHGWEASIGESDDGGARFEILTA